MLAKIRKNLIGDKAFYRAVLLVAFPIMIQNGFTTFVNMLDNIMVGRIGTDQMTGVAIANQLILIFNLAIFGAVSGAGIFGAQFFGKGDKKGVIYSFRFKIIAAILICALGAGIFLVFGDELVLMYLRGEGDVANIEASLDYGVRYLNIMLIGFLPFALCQCYSGTLREGGETMLPMKSGVAAVLINLVGNALLIFGPWIFPSLGSDGAAIATVLSRFVELAIVVWWTHFRSKEFSFMNEAYRAFHIPRDLLFGIIKKATPLMLNETFWSLALALNTQCFSTRGYDVVSAVNIASTVNNVFSIVFMSMGNAIAIILGQHLGANRTEQAVSDSYKLITFSTLCGTVCGALLAAVSPFFPLIYNTTDSVKSLATSLIIVLAIRMPINAMANASYFTVRSGGRVFLTILLDTVYIYVITIPLTFGLAYLTAIPIIPLYFISQMADIGKCILGPAIVAKKIWVRNIVGK